MPFPITRLVNVPQICHKGKYVLFWLGFFFFFSPLIALGSFRSQLYLPEGLSRALTGPFLVSSGLWWWWTSAFPPRKVSSTRRQGKGGQWALAAKKETASEETQPSGTAGLPWGGWHGPKRGCSPPVGHRGCVALAQAEKSVTFPARSFPFPAVLSLISPTL